ncbi:MAG: LysR family transcriptional regulator [Lachnospiraceae bacterium]
MDIIKYALFSDVAETKNFTKSGERMGYTQPGVSRILKLLESECGFPLFLRTKQGVELTADAQRILPLVRQLLASNELLEQTIASINGLEKGHIKIASFSSISRNWLPTIIYSFRKEYPNIEIELLEGGTDEIVDWIENNIADFGLLSKQHIAPLEWISLYEDPLMAILPLNYPISSRESFPITDMARQPFIISAEGVDYDIHYALKQSGIQPQIQFSSKDDHAIVSMVANQLGISILPNLVIEGVRNQILALPLEPFFSRELGIAIRSWENLSPAASRFIKFIEEKLPEIL